MRRLQASATDVAVLQDLSTLCPVCTYPIEPGDVVLVITLNEVLIDRANNIVYQDVVFDDGAGERVVHRDCLALAPDHGCLQ